MLVDEGFTSLEEIAYVPLEEPGRRRCRTSGYKPAVTLSHKKELFSSLDLKGNDKSMVLITPEAVVVAEDRAGADVGARADRAVAQIGQVIGLGAPGHPRGLTTGYAGGFLLRAAGARRPGSRRGRSRRRVARTGVGAGWPDPR